MNFFSIAKSFVILLVRIGVSGKKVDSLRDIALRSNWARSDTFITELMDLVPRIKPENHRKAIKLIIPFMEKDFATSANVNSLLRDLAGLLKE